MNENQLKELMDKPEARKRISIIKTTVVKERSMLYGARQINSSHLAAGLVNELYENADREILIACFLDSKCNPMAMEIIAIGSIDTCIVSPREVFKSAILSNAKNIIIFHNHPSGDSMPSSEDISVTKRLIDAGELLGISVLDHIIIGFGNSYHSIREAGAVSFDSKPQLYMK